MRSIAPAAGCGPGWGKVSGRVLYKGAPLPGGRLTFRPADPAQNSVSVELDGQGNYQAVLPVGGVKVCVDNRQLAPRAGGARGLPANLPLSPALREKLGGGGGDRPAPKSGEKVPRKSSGRFVPIPKKYYTVEKSGLEVTVKGGSQKHDIELTK